MPISMIIGIIFYIPLSKLSSLTQYLIFLMLLISYTNISLKDIRLSRLHCYLLAIQVVGSIIVYGIIHLVNPTIAQGTMICILAPTATSAIVITGMLGGNTASLTAYSLLSNLTVAIIAPVFFSLLNSNPQIHFWDEFFQISGQVVLLLLLPFFISIVMEKFIPSLHSTIRSAQSASFLLWNIALIIVTARTVSFLIDEGSSQKTTVISLFFTSCIVCLLQFKLGRKLGRPFGDTIAAGQGLGQKNTVLTIWMAQTFLNPISSVGPGAYVLWQNIINSYQVWKKGRNN